MHNSYYMYHSFLYIHTDPFLCVMFLDEGTHKTLKHILKLNIVPQIIGRVGASPPSRATGAIFLYIYIYIYISDAQCVHIPYRSKCFYALLF